MTPEAQRIAIAEACGWNVQRKQVITSSLIGFPPNSKSIDDWKVLPDYLNDLNAMHEAEKVLKNDEQLERYWVLLVPICDPKDDCGANSRWICAHATAAQRAEAFLRTLNLWKE
jgi:hypothetical protein